MIEIYFVSKKIISTFSDVRDMEKAMLLILFQDQNQTFSNVFKHKKTNKLFIIFLIKKREIFVENNFQHNHLLKKIFIFKWKIIEYFENALSVCLDSGKPSTFCAFNIF